MHLFISTKHLYSQSTIQTNVKLFYYRSAECSYLVIQNVPKKSLRTTCFVCYGQSAIQDSPWSTNMKDTSFTEFSVGKIAFHTSLFDQTVRWPKIKRLFSTTMCIPFDETTHCANPHLVNPLWRRFSTTENMLKMDPTDEFWGMGTGCGICACKPRQYRFKSLFFTMISENMVHRVGRKKLGSLTV